MKIIYVGRENRRRQALREKESDYLALIPSDWDDFGYRTTLRTESKLAGGSVQLGDIRILFEGEQNTTTYLESQLKSGWDGVFPPPSENFISTPLSLSFYEIPVKTIGLERTVEMAHQLRDASYMVRIAQDEKAFRLSASDGFVKSLRRESGAYKAFLDGWRLLLGQSTAIGNLAFRFQSASSALLDLQLRFDDATGVLPRDINVLIGSNGVGKSRLLFQMVESWFDIDSETSNGVGFRERPALNQIVMISYSPFEDFPVVTPDNVKRRDRDIYRYFGLRGQQRDLTSEGRSERVVLSRDFPKASAAQALLDCLRQDQNYAAVPEWSNRLRTMKSVLQEAIEFDDITVKVDPTVDPNDFYREAIDGDDMYIDVVHQDVDSTAPPGRYIAVDSFKARVLNTAYLSKHAKALEGVAFFKNGQIVSLSSGQRLFSYLVINVLGAIRRNSLLLIDEPELFLHPTLEIAFLRMLKTILRNFESKGLIATHSLVAVRETPSDCVHVLERTDNGIRVSRPPFETFGGDIQRISTYVFGDKSVSKPFEDWLQAKIAEFGGADELLNALGSAVNEEMLIQIHAMSKKQW